MKKSKLSPVGKYLRKKRVDLDESLRDMAKKIGVSAAGLCAVELGQKPMPARWVKVFKEVYRFPEEELSNCFLKSCHFLRIDRSKLTDDQFERICDILVEENSDSEESQE